MILDVRTSYLMGAGFVSIAGAHLLLLAYRLPGEVRASARTWALASFLFASSWTVYAFSDRLPDVAYVLFGNLAYLVAVTMVYNSLRQFDGLQPRRRLYPFVVLPAILATLAGRYLFESYDFRVIVMSVAVAVPLGFSALHVLRRRAEPGASDLGRHSLAAWLVVGACILLVRVGVTVTQGAAPPALDNGPIQTAALSFALVSVVGLIFAYFLLYMGRTTTDLQHHADRDPLTGVYNRRAFELLANRQIALARTHGHPVALLVMDADDFKPINDEWGHAVGDQALRAIAHALRSNLRTQDVLARLGGDEFAALLPGVDRDAASDLAQRLRHAVATAAVPHPVDLGISVGLGMLQGDRDLRDLLGSADQDLYVQKRQRAAATERIGRSDPRRHSDDTEEVNRSEDRTRSEPSSRNEND